MRLPIFAVQRQFRGCGDQHCSYSSFVYSGAKATRYFRDNSSVETKRNMLDLCVGDGATQGFALSKIWQKKQGDWKDWPKRNVSRENLRVSFNVTDTRKQNKFRSQWYASSLEKEERRMFSEILSCISGRRACEIVHGNIRGLDQEGILWSGQLVRDLGEMYRDSGIKLRLTLNWIFSNLYIFD